MNAQLDPLIEWAASCLGRSAEEDTDTRWLHWVALWSNLKSGRAAQGILDELILSLGRRCCFRVSSTGLS